MRGGTARAVLAVMSTSSSPASQSEIQKAIGFINSGQYSAAEQTLLAIRDPAARATVLQLRGMVARRTKDLAGSVKLFRESLAIDPRQSHVFNNMGLSLRDLGDLDGAVAAFKQAVVLVPTYHEAFHNLGVTYLALNDLGNALGCFGRAIQINNSYGPAYDGACIGLTRQERFAEAVEAGKMAVQLSPQSAAAVHNFGKALMALGRYPEAAGALYRATELDPKSDSSWLELGNARQYWGKPDDAIQAYRQAIAINPENEAAHRNYNELIWTLNQREEYLQSFPYAIEAAPKAANLRIAFAEELLKINRSEEALTQLKAAEAIGPGSPRLHDALGRAHSISGDADAACAYHARAVEAAPEVARYAKAYAESLLLANKVGPVLDLTRRVLDRMPDEQGLIGLRALALRLAGEAEYASLADYAALPGVMTLEPPAGYDDIESFNAALAQYLDGLHQTVNHPTEQTLRGGTQTLGNLFLRPDPIIQELKAQIEKAVLGYIASLPDDRAHPFLRRKSSKIGFAGSWSARLKSQGFHTNHVHPDGWISSAYYLELPPEIADTERKQGWFKMGESNLNLPGGEVVERFVQPVSGRLVLFPSYMWHGTVPFSSDAARTTVAFDVVPR